MRIIQLIFRQMNMNDRKHFQSQHLDNCCANTDFRNEIIYSQLAMYNFIVIGINGHGYTYVFMIQLFNNEFMFFI